MFIIIKFVRSEKRKISYVNLLAIIVIVLMFVATPAYAGTAQSTDILVQCNSSGVITNNTAITSANIPTIQYDTSGNYYANSVDVSIFTGNTLVKELDGYTTTNLQVALGAVTNYDYNATSPVVYEIKYRGHYSVVGSGVQNITEDWQSSGLYFEVVVSPTVTGISPASGPTTGGTAVTITGAGFIGATAVKFGSISGTGLIVNGDTSISITTPPGNGTVDVTVIGPGGTSATSSKDQFTYPDCLVTYRGAQKRLNGDGTYDIRFIATIDTLEPDSVGFVFSKSILIPTKDNVSSAQVKSTTTVYNAVTASGSTVYAADLHGKYIIACTVTGIPATDIGIPLYVRGFSTKETVTTYTPVQTVITSSLP